MPLATTPSALSDRVGSLGLLLPPMFPVPVVTTSGTTSLPTAGSTTWIADLASGAEDVGAAGVWASDHLFWKRPAAECLTSIAVAAAATRSVAVGACVLQLPLRAPAAVAKQAAALQLLSEGRFVLGVGVGSHPEEYRLAGVPYRTRGKALDTGMAALHDAWGTAGGPGGYRLEPSPAVPVWVGGSSPAAIQRAAATGDGWVPLFVGPEEYAASLARLRDAAVAEGRGRDAVFPAVVMVATVGDDATTAKTAGAAWLSDLYGLPAKAFERRLVAGPAEDCALAAARYVAAGAAHVVVLVAADDALAQFRALAAAYDRLDLRDVLAGARSSQAMAGVGA